MHLHRILLFSADFPKGKRAVVMTLMATTHGPGPLNCSDPDPQNTFLRVTLNFFVVGNLLLSAIQLKSLVVVVF